MLIQACCLWLRGTRFYQQPCKQQSHLRVIIKLTNNRIPCAAIR